MCGKTACQIFTKSNFDNAHHLNHTSMKDKWAQSRKGQKERSVDLSTQLSSELQNTKQIITPCAALYFVKNLRQLGDTRIPYTIPSKKPIKHNCWYHYICLTSTGISGIGHWFDDFQLIWSGCSQNTGQQLDMVVHLSSRTPSIAQLLTQQLLISLSQTSHKLWKEQISWWTDASSRCKCCHCNSDFCCNTETFGAEPIIKIISHGGDNNIGT